MVLLLSRMWFLFLFSLDSVFLSYNHILVRLLVLSNLNYLLGLISMPLMPTTFSTHPAAYKTSSLMQPFPTRSLWRKRCRSKSSTPLAPASYPTLPGRAHSWLRLPSLLPWWAYPLSPHYPQIWMTLAIWIQIMFCFSLEVDSIAEMNMWAWLVADGFVGLILLHYYT